MQQAPMIPMMPTYPPANITTEQIQKYLDENKKLILAILENQNLGKLAECAQFQAQLQRNLMYLAAIADAQPQAPALPAQMAPHPAVQPGGFYMQHPQAAAMAQQPGIFPQKLPIQFNTPPPIPDQQHQQYLHQQHQQAMQGQLGMRPAGANNGMHPLHAEASLGGVGGGASAGPSDGRGGSEQDAPKAGAAGGTDGHGGSASGHGGGDGESSYKKGAQDVK